MAIRSLIEQMKADAGASGVMQADAGETVTYNAVASQANGGATATTTITAVIDRGEDRDGEEEEVIVKTARLFFTGGASVTGDTVAPSLRDYVTFDSADWSVTNVGPGGPQSAMWLIEVRRIDEKHATAKGVRRRA